MTGISRSAADHVCLLVLCIICGVTGSVHGADERPDLADAPDAERESIMRFLTSDAWPHRAIGLLRLERFACDDSRALIEQRLADRSWQVRTYAIRALTYRGAAVPSTLGENEMHPRVVRTMLRHHVPFDLEKLERGIDRLARSSAMDDRLLAVELAAAAQHPPLENDAIKTLKTVINRMSRTEAGTLSPRLDALTGAGDLRRDFRWRTWLLKNTRVISLQPGFAFDKGAPPTELNAIAALSPDRFTALRDYMDTLHDRDVELVVCLDCTASMGKELSQAQGELDAMTLFLSDIVRSLRVGLVAYRDRRDDFETRALDLTNVYSEVRRALWTLSADQGGDSPEAVHPAMKRAVFEMSWSTDAEKMLVIVGDAPPHVGYGEACINMARNAARDGNLVTHTVEAKGKPVKHFKEIARAGGGDCISLEDQSSLVVELAGLSVTEQYRSQFREFFRIYLRLCR
ncbi:MAG: vWA domain-containing protein [Planctomycetota bacterium]